MNKVFALAVFVGVTVANRCGGNCPSNDCGACQCPQTPSYQSIDAWCAKHNWNQACCRCVVTHESSGNAHAQNDNTNGSHDVGIFQINSINWPACNGGHAPCDLNQNLACAIQIYQRAGNTWSPWSTSRGCGCHGAHVEEEIQAALEASAETTTTAEALVQ